MNQINFNDRPTTKKGKIGEEIVRQYLESKGWIIYEPKTEDKPHAFDKLAIKDKKHIVIAEVKTKAARNYYPDTGIDIRHYEEYKLISEKHKMPVFLFFVDENKGEVYGNKLSELEKEHLVQGNNYPLKQNGIIYFPVIKGDGSENMISIAKLSEEDVEQLKKLNTRNYEYQKEEHIDTKGVKPRRVYKLDNFKKNAKGNLNSG